MRPLGERGAPSRSWLPAKVAWESEAIDIALLQVLGGDTGIVGTVAFGEVVGDTRVTAVGFPIVERRSDRVRDTDVATGEVLYGAGWKRNRLVFDVQSSVADLLEGTDQQSTWEGISGAGLMVGHRLVGVIVEDHFPRQHHGRRLDVVPISTILQEAGFRQAARTFGINLQLYSIGAPSMGRLEPASLPPSVVDRVAPRQAIIDALLGGPAQIVALVGPPGFGKSTLALAVCHDVAIRQAFPGGALWLTFGKEPDLVATLSQALADLTGHLPAAATADDLAQRVGEQLTERSAILIVDDVWQQTPLNVLLGHTGCVPRLVTAQNVALLDDWTGTIIPIDQPLTIDEAVALLAPTPHIGDAERVVLADVASKLGGWPLLLSLASGHLRRLTRHGLPLFKTAARLEQQYVQHGVVAFDVQRPEQRQQAVTATLGASLAQLSDEDRTRYTSLAIFPSAEEVPLDILAEFWGLGIDATENLLLDLADRSLLRYDLKEQAARVHAVIHDFIYRHLAAPAAIHGELVQRWGDPLILSDPYKMSQICWHFAQAGDIDKLFELVDDMEWYEAQFRRDPSGSAYLRDLGYVWSVASDLDRAQLEKTDEAPLLSREMRCAIVTASVNSWAKGLRVKLLVGLVKAGLWKWSDALAAVRQNPFNSARRYALTILASHLKGTLVNDALVIARDINSAADAALALAALAPLLPEAEQRGVTDEARDLARSVEGPDAIDAMAGVIKLLHGQARSDLLREARRRADESEDPKSRFDGLMALSKNLTNEDDGVTDELLEAADDIDYVVDRVHAFVEVAHHLPEDQRSAALTAAWASFDRIEDPDERRSLLIDLADFAPVERLDDLREAGLDALATVHDPYRSAEGAAVVGRALARAPRSSATALEKVLTQVDTLQDLATKVAVLSALAREFGEPIQSALMEDAFEVLRSMSVDERLDGLLHILDFAPDSFRHGMLSELLAEVRNIEPISRRAAALREVALQYPEPLQLVLLREAHETNPVLKRDPPEQDGDAFVIATTALLPRLSIDERVLLVEEALAAARELDNLYDQAMSLIALLPYLPPRDHPGIVDEALNAAQQGGDEAQAFAFVALIPYLQDDAREQIFAAAVDHARALDYTWGFSTKIVVTEDETVEISELLPGGGRARAHLLAQLADLAPLEQRSVLANEALRTVYALGLNLPLGWRDTLALIAPYLPEAEARELLTALHGRDPLRLRVLTLLLTRLADIESTQSARRQAVAIWGQSIPAPVHASFAHSTVPGMDDGQLSEIDESQENPLVATNEFSTDESDDEMHVEAEIDSMDPDFSLKLFRHILPIRTIASASFTLPRYHEDLRAEIEGQLLDAVVDLHISKLQPDQVRRLLTDAVELVRGGEWAEVKTALIRRLVTLGLTDFAVDEVRASWQEDPPAPAFVAVADHMQIADRNRFATRSLAATWKIGDHLARARALRTLLPYIADRERARAMEDIAESVRNKLVQDAPDDDTISELSELLEVLPPHHRLPLWQQMLRMGVARRSLFAQLPAIMVAVESLGSPRLPSEAAEALIDIRHRWP